ncbi:flocculation protein FLO11-like [Penaeus chinensis]|uniref:flocculation protein FLO11-like n=1 Tax=Penaeus chinensis TaxID=139456 RepID=UPI001FB5AB41|nr:flocculation protein FLO11-like [Penaeus chinensis]
MASVRVILLLWSLALLTASAQHQDEKSIHLTVTQKAKEPKTATKQQELEEGSGREEEESADKLLQDLYIHSTSPVLVSYLGHLATPRDLSQLDAIIRRQRQIRFKSSYQELPVVLRQPVGAKDLTGLSYFIRVDVDEDPPPSTALTLLPEGARTYFPPQVTTPHRKIKSRPNKDKKEKDEDSPLLLQEHTSQKTSKGPQRDGPSKPVAVGGYRDNSDYVTSKTSSTSTASRLVASPPSSSFSPANPTISQAKDPRFLAKGLTVSSRYTTFPQSSLQPSHDRSLTSGHSSSQRSPVSENLIIHNLLPSDSSASFLPSPSGPHSFSSNVSDVSDPVHSSIVTSQPIFIFESPGSSSSQSSSDSFAPPVSPSPVKALNAPSQYLELPNLFPLHPGVSLPTQSLEPAHSLSQSFATPSSPSLNIQSLSQHLEQPLVTSHSSRLPQITKSTAISSDQKTPLPPNSLRLSKAIQVFSQPSSQSNRPFHELSSIIDTQRAPVFNSPASPVSLKVSQELEPPFHPFSQSGHASNPLPVPSPLSSNPSRPSKSFPRPFSTPPPQPSPLHPSHPKGTPSSSSSASSITTASLGAKASSSLASPTPTQKLSQESISASKLQANTNTFSKHRSRQNQTPLTSSKVSDPRPNAKAKSISSKPVNSIQQSEALRRGRSGQGGSRNRERDRGSGDGEGRQIQSGINSATPVDGKTRTVLNSDDPYVNSIPGRSGIDYPTFQTLPKTGFDCSSKQSGGYYADPEADCQVFHVCWGRRRASFLCPIGTIFNQQVLVCDWWYNVDCAASPEHEGVNAGIWEPRVTRNRL